MLRPLVFCDERKRAENLTRHQIDLHDAERFVWDTALVFDTYGSKYGGTRYEAIGFVGDRLRALIFSPLGEDAISVISMRPASRKERRTYDQR